MTPDRSRFSRACFRRSSGSSHRAGCRKGVFFGTHDRPFSTTAWTLKLDRLNTVTDFV